MGLVERMGLMGQMGLVRQMGWVKRMGWWVLAYLAVKWALLGGAIYWLMRFDWFRTEYLLALPALVLSVAGIKWAMARRRVAG